MFVAAVCVIVLDGLRVNMIFFSLVSRYICLGHSRKTHFFPDALPMV